MRIKRFNEDFENSDNNFNFDYVYHCFSDLLEYIDPKTGEKDDKWWVNRNKK